MVILLDLETLSFGMLACFDFVLPPSMLLGFQILLSHTGPQSDVVCTDFAKAGVRHDVLELCLRR